MSSDIATTFRGMIAAGGTATERDLLAVVGDLTRVSISAATELERLSVASQTKVRGDWRTIPNAALSPKHGLVIFFAWLERGRPIVEKPRFDFW